MELHYKSFGAGPPLIILHGLFGSLDNWQTLARQFAEHYTVFIVDQRNHGKSPHMHEMDYPILAEDLKHFMEANWIHRASILGHSMGGKVAMQFALEYPEMVEKLIIVDIAPKSYPPGHLPIFKALFDLPIANTKDRRDLDALLKKRIKSFAIRQFLLKNLKRKPTGGFEFKMNLPVIYKNYEKLIGSFNTHDSFDGPTYFLKGNQSDYVTEEDIPMIKSVFPMAKIEGIDQAGHWVHAEQPKAFFENVNRFLLS